MIKGVAAKKILDSRNKPTIECVITTNTGVVKASIPFGASRGDYEAFFIENDAAIKNVNEIIAKKLVGAKIEQKNIDDLLIEMDGTENKKNLGANAILAVSIAACKAGALEASIPLYKYIGNLASEKPALPMPMMVFIEGGKHSHLPSTDMQEFMIVPKGKNFEESMEFGKDLYNKLKEYLKSLGMNTDIGDEGAFTPKLDSNEKAIEILTKVIEESGYDKKIVIALDCAASEFYKNGKYSLKREGRTLDSSDLIDLYNEWVGKYPIISIEDGLSQHDLNGWKELNEKLGEKINIVGDDLTVTNIKRLAMVTGNINAVIIKPTQIGTISETLEFAEMARKNNMATIVSHRGGETMDDFKADLAAGISSKFAKFGAPSKPERIVKYDRLLKIEEELRQ